MREFYPDAHIAYLMKRYVKPLYTGMPWADQLITYRTGKTAKRAGKGLFGLAWRLHPGGSIWRCCCRILSRPR